MQLTFSLTGYDPRTELLAQEYDIPPQMVQAAMRAVGIEYPRGRPPVDHALSHAQARDIAGILGVKIDQRLDFFFEAHADERAHA